MDLRIELADDEGMALSARARRQGMSAEQYARHVLEEDLRAQSIAPDKPVRQPISQVIAGIMADTPAEELAKLPIDGASQHDHYLYGWPKRSS